MSDERDAALCRLWGEGLSAVAIGRRLGMSSLAVYRRTQQLGLPLRKRGDSGRPVSGA